MRGVSPSALAIVASLLIAGCGQPSGTPKELVGTYTATMMASGYRTSTPSLVLRANGSFDFPDLRSANGELYVSGGWSESNGVVTMKCSQGGFCSAVHGISFQAQELGRNLGSPSRPGTYREGKPSRVGSWYAIRR